MNKRFFIIGLGAFTILLAAVYMLSRSEVPPPAKDEPVIPGKETTSRKLLVEREADHARPGSAPVPKEPSLSTTEWNQQRDAILASSAPSPEKASRLHELLPRLSETDEVEATKHLLNLLSDDQFPTIGELITNAQTPNAVQELMFNDSLNRPERVKYPIWLSVARTADNPRAETARNMLVATLPQDCGTNWAAWEAQIQSRLKPGQ